VVSQPITDPCADNKEIKGDQHTHTHTEARLCMCVPQHTPTPSQLDRIHGHVCLIKCVYAISRLEKHTHTQTRVDPEI